MPPAGDDDLFTELVVRRGDALRRTAFLVIGDWHLAEDLLQTALANTWRRWNKLDDPVAAEAYVRQAIVRTAISWRRRRWNAERPYDVTPDVAVDDRAYSELEGADSVRHLLATLTPRQRAVVVLRYYEGLSEAETAETLRCSLGTVKSTASRALAQLRDAASTTTTEDEA